MKKIIVPKVHEEVKYFCDKHPDRECYSDLLTRSWYGSGFDMMGVETHLCDECLETLFKYLEQQFGVKPQDKNMI